MDDIEKVGAAMRLQQLAKQRAQQLNEISNLVVHPRFILQEPFTYNHIRERAIAYEADFSYFEHDKKVVEDVKGFKTREYEIKRKLFLYKWHNVDFREIAS
jgi:hypothetical protein